jgi:hypothetical protein
MRENLLWGGAVALLAIGVALVFGAVLARGLFLAGVALIDLGVVVLAAAAVLSLRRPAES